VQEHVRHRGTRGEECERGHTRQLRIVGGRNWGRSSTGRTSGDGGGGGELVCMGEVGVAA